MPNSATELAFINVSGISDRDTKATSRVVRSHVMRRYKREQRTEAQSKGHHPERVTKSRKTEHSPSSTLRSKTRASPAASTVSVFDQGDATALAAQSSPLPITESSGPGTSPQVQFEDPADDHSLASEDDSLYEGSQSLTSSPLTLTSWLDGDWNPFSCLAIETTPRMKMLLHHNASFSVRTSVHADVDNVYRRACSSDPAYLFMGVFYSSKRFTQSMSEDITYLVNAINCINKTIEQSPTTIGDSTIATVASLSNIENLCGASSEAAVHLGGLLRMVELRGGVESLGSGGLLRRVVQWSDLLASSRSARHPALPYLSIDHDKPLEDFTPEDSKADYHIAPHKEVEEITSKTLQISIAWILRSLHHCSTFLNLIGPRRLPWKAAYPDRVYAVEHRILTMLFNDVLVASAETPAVLGHILLHSSLLFVYTNAREAPVGQMIRLELLERLRTALDNAGMHQVEHQFPAEMLWVYVLGGTTAKSMAMMSSGGFGSWYQHGNLFADGIRRVSALLGIEEWPGVQETLRNMPALETAFALQSASMWNELHSVVHER